MKQLSAPPKTDSIQPTEVWSPSQGGAPMPIGADLQRGRGTHDDRVHSVSWWSSEPYNYHVDGGRWTPYPKNPASCRHYKKRFAAGVWICAECGSPQ